MENSDTSILLYDQNVLPAVMQLVDEATRQIVLVSPFNDYSTPLRESLERAAKRTGVRIVVVCRADMAEKERAHLEWLSTLGADIHLVERLHSKIYLNESAAVVTSMNLTKGSAVDSREIGFRITDAKTREEITEYVREKLISTAHPWRAAAAAPPRQAASRPSRSSPKAPRPSPSRARQSAKLPTTLGGIGVAATDGQCIRCNTSLPYNTEKPLCGACFKRWNVFGEPDYREKHCHRCGKTRKTSLRKPLCDPCYAETS